MNQFQRDLAHAKDISADAALEREIETARLAATKATDPLLAREFFSAMAQLIAQRSPEQIAKMEIERGLRAP